MKKAKIVIEKILRPPVWVVIGLPFIAFAGLIYIFAADQTRGASAYVFYGLSAYALVILSFRFPSLVKRVKIKVRKTIAEKSESIVFLKNYLTDIRFKGGVGLYRGALMNAIYTVFRIVTGVLYSSVWFISLSVYHLVLGLLRAYLIRCRKNEKTRSLGIVYEYKCFAKTARLLFLLNIPMAGMILLTVIKNSGFLYPGYVIYVSAIYTFYMAILSVVNLVKYRKIGSPVLSAAKVINFIAAMMSVLGLQTAMLSAFAVDDGGYRRTMNAVTGGVVFGIVIVTAIVMLIIARRKIEEFEKNNGDKTHEQIGE